MVFVIVVVVVVIVAIVLVGCVLAVQTQGLAHPSKSSAIFSSQMILTPQ